MRRGLVLLSIVLVAALVAVWLRMRDGGGCGAGRRIERMQASDPSPPLLRGTGGGPVSQEPPRKTKHAPVRIAPASGGPAFAPPAPTRPVPPPAEPARLHLRVVDTRGRPRPAVRVALYRRLECVNSMTHQLSTDEAGEVRIDDAHPGPGRIELQVAGARWERGVVLRAQESLDLEVVAPLGGTVTGAVRHVERGVLAGVGISIRLERDGWQVEWQASSDEAGRYCFKGVAPGTQAVSLQGTAVGFVQRPRAVVTVVEGVVIETDIVLGRVAIEGTVRDAATGRLLPGVQGDLEESRAPFATDASGRWRVFDLPAGSYRVRFEREGYARHVTQPVEVTDEGPVRLEVELEPSAMLLLRFREPDGRCAPGWYRIALTARDAEGAMPTTRRHIATDEFGVGKVQGVGPGRWTVAATGSGYAIDPVQVEVGRDETPVDLLCRLVERDGSLLIRGVVRDASTRLPVAGASVTLRRASVGNAVTDHRGVYEIWGQADRPLRLAVLKDGYVMQFPPEIMVRANATQVLDVELVPAATLHVWIADAHGQPVVGHVILLVAQKVEDGAETGLGFDLTADAEGRVLWRRSAPGRYRLSVMSDTHGTGTVDAEVKPGENTFHIRLR